MGKRSLHLLVALSVLPAMLISFAGTGYAVTVPSPVGDAPVLIPGSEPSGEDEGGDDVLINNDYVLSREAGDEPLTVEQAGQLRSAGADQTTRIRQQPIPSGTVTFKSAWAGIGPSPIIQIQRSTKTHEAFFRGPKRRMSASTGTASTVGPGAFAAKSRPSQPGGCSRESSQTNALSLT